MGLSRIIGNGMAGAALLALAVACSHPSEPVQEAGHPVASHPTPRARTTVAVPTLLGLSVDALAQHLGPPRPVPTAVQALLDQLPGADPADSTRFFRCRNLDVLVSYDAGTRRCNDLLLLGSDEDLLMQRAGLMAEAANYLLLPVFYVHRPAQLLGLRVVPLDPKQLQ